MGHKDFYIPGKNRLGVREHAGEIAVAPHHFNGQIRIEGQDFIYFPFPIPQMQKQGRFFPVLFHNAAQGAEIPVGIGNDNDAHFTSPLHKSNVRIISIRYPGRFVNSPIYHRTERQADSMDLNNPNVSKLLNMVGKKLGQDPKTLERDLAAGKFDSVLQNLSPKDAANFQRLVNNPSLAQQVINTPQAQQTLKSIIEGAQQKK